MTATVRVGGVEFSDLRVPDADGCLWVLSGLRGWDDDVDVRFDATERPNAHGSFAERGWRGGRTLVVEGHVICPTRELAASVKRRLSAVLADGSFGEFVVDDSGVGELRALVQIGGAPTVAWMGAEQRAVRYQGIFYAPDPLRYGPLASVTTGFPELVGGLRYPLYTDGAGTTLGWLDYGEPSTSGTVALSNPGTADAHPQFEVTGPAPGFEVVQVGTGHRLVFDESIPAGSRLVIDTASGVAVMDGVSDRTLTWQDPMTVGPGETAEFAFVPRGESTAAVLRASLRPAYW